MILVLFTLLIMIGVGLALMREGIVRAFLMLVNLVIAGFLTFNFFEPLASGIESVFPSMNIFADALTMLILLLLFLGILRVATWWLLQKDVNLPRAIRLTGGAFFGLVTGYFLAAILICLFQTLPVHERFLGYDPDRPLGLGAPDRVWLAMMHRASGRILEHAGEREKWFDADGSFIPRYARYRRWRDTGVDVNQGEFPPSLPTRPVEPTESP